jgi:hypothetical protein
VNKFLPYLILLIVASAVVGCGEDFNTVKEVPSTSFTVNQINELEYYSEILNKYALDKYPIKNCIAKTIAVKLDLSELKSLSEDIKAKIKKDYIMTKQNFNCHYKIVSWGCGTGCQMILVINILNGKVIKSFTSSLGYEFDPMSRLLILNPPKETLIDSNYRNTFGHPEVWELKNEIFNKIN